MSNTKTGFNPNFRDDVMDIGSLYIPLFLPKEEKWNDNLWIMKKIKRSYEFAGERDKYLIPYEVTALVMKNPKAKNIVLTDDKDQIVNDSTRDGILNFMFPPKAWMSDDAQERTMMYTSAKEAFGDILVGGLGLLIYPQFVLILKRPVKSITIVEQDSLIIEKVGKPWLESLDEDARNKITFINDKIENYLENTKQNYDTIYLDTWDDSDPRYLAHINFLVSLSEKKLNKNGVIHCWSYAITVDAFLRIIEHFENKNIDYNNIDEDIDPVFKTFINWKNENSDIKNIDIILNKAKEIATTVCCYCDYDEIKSFYTPYEKPKY